MKRYALISVNETQGILHFAKVLTSIGLSIVATDKPYKLLKEAGLNVITVSTLVGIREKYAFPPTLHPKIEHLLTDNTANERIDIVYDITYGLDVGNDVGGHTLLALAAKGNRLPVSSYDDMCEVISLIERDGNVPDNKRIELIAKANLKVATHYNSLLMTSGQQPYDIVVMREKMKLLNGENPYQVPSDFMLVESEDPLALQNFDLVTSNVPCFTNMADIDCILNTLCKLAIAFNINCGKVPFITVAAKHGNACGIGICWKDPSASIQKALWGNPLAIWGGEVIVNFPISADTASLLYSSKERENKYGSGKWMLDVILAPEINDSAHKILEQRKNTKLFVNKALANPALPLVKWQGRFVRGGILRQPSASYVLDLKDVRWVGQPILNEGVDSLIVSWASSFTSNFGGNEVAIAAKGQLLGCGGGPSTVEAAELAIQKGIKYNKSIEGAIFAADAFFPFTDAPEILVKAGCLGGVVPSGGTKEKDVTKFFEDKNLKVAFLKEAYRGFCRH